LLNVKGKIRREVAALGEPLRSLPLRSVSAGVGSSSGAPLLSELADGFEDVLDREV
jgi:hypothetical protein